MNKKVQNKPKEILILYEYFFPGFKAGGPIQSLTNMVIALQPQYKFSVITTAYDLNSANPYQSIKTNCWNDVLLPEATASIKVWYSDKQTISFISLLNLIRESNCSIIFINGFYTKLFLFPLIFKRIGLLQKIEIVVSPRGMLQAGALAVKSRKKKLYLNFLKRASFLKRVSFHATNAEEKNDIINIFGNKNSITVAGNIPKKPLSSPKISTKKEGTLNLIYLSLITEKKNLLLLLECLQYCKQNILLSVYGPPKDQQYWVKCQQQIKKLPSNVQVKYCNAIESEKVQATIANFDALILLTKGENFGHALYESLSTSTPVITSFFTPWQNLQKKKAGWNIDINNKEEIIQTINEISFLDHFQWQQYCNGALKVANDYYNNSNFVQQYCNLFK